MSSLHPQNALSAREGENTVSIGLTSEEELRRLSDSRLLTCPFCGSGVIFRAGSIRAQHFAHRTGATCWAAQTEPETEEHRAGKILLAQWLKQALPNANICLEAPIAETDQRADVLATLQEERIAIEFQCASLRPKEWARRSALYRAAGYRDLWILGGSRLAWERSGENLRLLGEELERALFSAGAPLLFFDPLGAKITAEHMARFRPNPAATAAAMQGKISLAPLKNLAFPFALLNYVPREGEAPSLGEALLVSLSQGEEPLAGGATDRWVWLWLTNRFQVTPSNLPSFFGIETKGSEAFGCAKEVWQAAIYYRFVHRKTGGSWRLWDVERWAQTYLPLSKPIQEKRLRKALLDYQEMLGAAGLLTVPQGYEKANARIIADLTSLSTPPDREEVLRLCRYRRTLRRGET